MNVGKRITPDVLRAETRLRGVERAWSESTDLHQARWRERRLRIIANFDNDVRDLLVKLDVISAQDLEDSRELVGQP